MAEAIDSALAQTYPKIEIIVVNDGSMDGGKTAAIAKSYGDAIRYLEQTNGGVGSALNTGIAAMRGAYFSWLSHDDVYLPEKIATQMRKISEFEETVIVFGNVRLIDEKCNTLDDMDYGSKFNENDESFWCVLGILLSGCTLLIPRICFETCGLFNPALPTTQDYDLWFRMTTRYRFVFTPEVETLSRQHADQGSRAIGHFDEMTLMFVRFIGKLPNVTRHRTPAGLLAIAQRAHTLPLCRVLPAVRLRIERWQSDIRAQARPLLVVPVADLRRALEARARLETVGYTQPDLVFVRRGLRSGHDMALEVAATQEPALHRHGLILLLADDATDRDVASSVAAVARPDQAILFWDEERLSDAAILQLLLDDVVTGRADAILSAPSTADRPLDGLIVRGSVLQQAAGGDAGDWHEWLDRLAPRQPTGRDALATDLPGASLAEPGPAIKKRRRVLLPRLLRASSWTAEKRRARIEALRGLVRPRGRNSSPSLSSASVALYPVPTEPLCAAAPVDSELLILIAPTEEARDWGRHLDRTLKSGVRRVFGHIAADGRLSLTVANRPNAVSFELPGDVEAAADYLRRCGIRRLDIVGNELPTPAFPLVQALALPFDVTVLAPPDPEAIEEAALLERAQRVIVPTGRLAERLSAVAGNRLHTMSVPGTREARSFYVEAPALIPGEALRVLVLSLVRPGSKSEELRRVAELLGSERANVELFAAGEPGSAAALAGVSWLGGYSDRRLIDYIGAVAPHSIWVVLDSAANVAPALLDVMWTGLPLLVTGPADATAPATGRALSATLPPAAPELAARWIRTFHNGEVRTPSAEPSYIPTFSRESYLGWLG